MASANLLLTFRHWRYISSFHGPWLQLPPEVLETLAYSNYTSPRPRPIDPAVFFDLVKIRRLVEEATNLAVRAANGTTSSSLNSSLNGGNGMLGGGGAAALGLGLGGGGGNAKLSRERKHRMRELATQKLSHAYHLDEIAASVATMQSASALEEVAKLVLQRAENNSDAKYVHFFHEKIPSRMLAQCTSLKSLDEVIADRATEGAPLRTRAVTRIFKDDFVGAARDLTEALAVHRYTTAQHKSGRGELQLANALGGAERRNGGGRDWRHEMRIEDDDQPSSLEPQLLFHRAGVYLTLAWQSVNTALDGLNISDERQQSTEACASDEQSSLSPAQKEARRRRLEARKQVKTYAKRAVRDYISFLSNYDYTPGLSPETMEEFYRKVNVAANGRTRRRSPSSNRLLESNLSDGDSLDALVPHKFGNISQSGSDGYQDSGTYPLLPAPEVHQISSLLSANPTVNLPPYPAESLALVPVIDKWQPVTSNDAETQLFASAGQHEAITYHPLLTDALHSLLLCHALVQTSPKELLRHAHMVARLARVCDGYPIFLAARSPSRADWIEVIRRGNNWLGLQQSWETLCAPAPLPGQPSTAKKEETEEQAKERRKQEAIMEALADERVHDEASFQAAVAARERRAEEQRREDLGLGGNGPKRWAQEDGKEYPISTERAEAIARWIREAPLAGADGSDKAKKSSRKARGKKGLGDGTTGLVGGIGSMAVDGTEEAAEEVVEEEVD